MVIQRLWKNAATSTATIDNSRHPEQSPAAAADDSSSSWAASGASAAAAAVHASCSGSGGSMMVHSNNVNTQVTTVTATVVSIRRCRSAVQAFCSGFSAPAYMHLSIQFRYFHPQKSHISNPQMAESVHRALRARYNGCTQRPAATTTTAPPQDAGAAAARRAMELMRDCVQDMFNDEVDAIVRRYMEVSVWAVRTSNKSINHRLFPPFGAQIYFKPALQNTRENLGIDAALSASDCVSIYAR